MSDLNIKPTHKPIKTYYAELENTRNSVKKTKAPSVPHSKISSNITATNPILLCSVKRHAPSLIQEPKKVTNTSDWTVKLSMRWGCHTATGKQRYTRRSPQ